MLNYIFDIDGTLRNFETKPNIHPELFNYLSKLKSKGSVYVVTGRTYNNFKNFHKELPSPTDGFKEDLFVKIFCEDGHICYKDNSPKVLVNNESLEQLKKIRRFIEKSISDNKYKEDFALPATDLVSEVTITIQGLKKPMLFSYQIENFIEKDKLHLLKVNRLTHNMLSISVKNVNKYSAVKSANIKLSSSTFFCDEKNDLELALNVKKSGGKVVVPKNAVNDIKLIADYISRESYSHGVVDYLSRYLIKSSY